MASPMRQAWSGRNASDSRSCSAARCTSASSAQKWLRRRMPLRDGRIAKATGSSGGIARVASTSKVPISAAGNGSSQHRQRLARANGANSERRRLSSILQRPISGTARRPVQPPTIHGSSCQSPRVQRCRRLTTTSKRDGGSSTTSTSEASPARAKTPSNRSWLSSSFSPTRPASDASKASTS
ncbi:hypothetical protein D3C78_831190 [compost metagenome]